MNPTCTLGRTEALTPKTKTITVSIADAQVGDLFSGTIITHPAKGGTDTRTFSQFPLTSSRARGARLYAVSSAPYIDDPSWIDVTITREVPVKTKTEAIRDLPVGTAFYNHDPAYVASSPNETTLQVWVKTGEDVVTTIRPDFKVFNRAWVYPITEFWFGAAPAPERFPVVIPASTQENGW